MAQTWPPSKWKSALVRTVDFFGRPAAALARRFRAPIPSEPVRNILVIEAWQIGDVVLTTPFLAALRGCFPDASVTLLAKPHASELLANTELVDDVLVFELPWTRPSRKYDPSAYDSRALSTLIRALRARRFDLCFDARMDIRSNVLSWLSGARRRVGFRYGGADWLLTDAVTVDPLAAHKVDDWFSLLAPVGCRPPTRIRCLLKTTAEEQSRAEAALQTARAAGSALIGIHPGASHTGKRWPLRNFAALAELLLERGNSIIVFADEHGFGSELAGIPGVIVSRTPLRPMMALIEKCDVFVCNDSGPMHIAAALGVRTVAIFERGEPRWFGPVGENHIVISGQRAGKDVSAAPVDEEPPNPVPVSRVLEAVITSSGAID